MKYNYKREPVSQGLRQAVNEKICRLIEYDEALDKGITKEDIFNLYTGDGGLHGLQASEYADYNAYKLAKQEIENGQFFTPPPVCEFIVQCLQISVSDTVADLTCGSGNFFNYLPVEGNAYGCDTSESAIQVARYLYPDAHLENADIRDYEPPVPLDFVVGNPPFNLRWQVEDDIMTGENVLSQAYYCQKAAAHMKPLGILALVVPCSYLADDFTDSRMIAAMEQQFSFLGQFRLSPSAFSYLGVRNFPSKVQFWQRRCDLPTWSARPYTTAMSLDVDIQQADALKKMRTLLAPAQQARETFRLHVILEAARGKHLCQGDFQYQVQKLLYQIRVHPRLKDKYPKCRDYLNAYVTQTQPANMEYEDWLKVRITSAKVLAYLRRALCSQNPRPPRHAGLVKQDYNLVYKGVQPPEGKGAVLPIYEAVLSEETPEYGKYTKLIEKKRREYRIENQKIQEIPEDTALAKWLDLFVLWDSAERKLIYLNDKQKQDINKILQKRALLLQWEQGSGKTLAGIATGQYRMQQSVCNTWVVSSAICIHNTWNIKLESYGIPHVLIRRLKDLRKIQPKDFVLITLDMLIKYRKPVKKWLRLHGRNVQLILDESDEISNLDSKRTKAVLDCFRRCRYKLPMTGTSIRNNIVEFFPQLELMYNNSVNMVSWCKDIYRMKDGEPTPEDNLYYGIPIPAYRRGKKLFSASHLPVKITVFGMEQETQDVYNAGILNDILDRCVITRTFEEVTGKDLKRIHQVPIRFSAEERTVYDLALERFYEIQARYFRSTGNSRKDSMMRIFQQIIMLLRISAAPDTVDEYDGGVPCKTQKIIQMIRRWENDYVAVGVRHILTLNAYKRAIQDALPDRPLFCVTGSSTSLAKRRELKKTLKESKNGILLCTQQSLPSSVDYEYVDKIIIPEFHYNNAGMSQFYHRFIRFTSTERKDIYFVIYPESLESNQMQMILCKEKLNLYMKGKDANLDEIYERFGVDYNLLSFMMRREKDKEGHLHIRWGEQKFVA